MSLPFTQAQFLDVFGAYNRALWPAALLLWLATVAVFAMWFRRREAAGPWIAGLLVLHWAWAGIVYHLVYFRSINPAAVVFGAAFLLEAVLLAWRGLARPGLSFSGRSSRGWTSAGVVLILYALLYPGLGLVFGLQFPRLPTFGVPCPTTILTAGFLLLVPPRRTRLLSVIPILWAALGASAALTLGVHADLALPVAGAAMLVHAVWKSTGRKGRTGRSV